MATIQINATFGAYYRQAAATQEHPGDGADITVGQYTAGGALDRGYMKIPFTGIPTGSTITAVTVDLYLTNVSFASNNRTLRLYRCKQALAYNSSWNEYVTGSAWQTAGAAGANDKEATDSGSLLVHTTDTVNQYYSVSMTLADIQAMYSGSYTNNGFILKMDTETNDMYIFNGSAGGNPPRFTITYTPPPSGFMLFSS